MANTIAYRRRKGTAAVVEQLAFDLTGHRARAVEYFQRTLATCNVQHARGLARHVPRGTVDLRRSTELQDVDGPFSEHPHLVDVRSIQRAKGRYNLPNLGVHVWRIGAAAVTRSTAPAIGGQTGWYRFDPYGADEPLYHLPQTEAEIHSLATPLNVPHPLRRLAVWAESQGQAPPGYLAPNPAFEIRVETAAGIGDPLPFEICNLADGSGGLPSHRPPAGVVAVDPELGRMVFALADVPPPGEHHEVLVDFAYGSAGDVGAGTFDRGPALEDQRDGDAFTWTRYVTRDATVAGEVASLATLEDAVVAWNAHVTAAGAGEVGRIVVLGGRNHPDRDPVAPQSRRYEPPATTIELPEGTRLYIVAASVDLVPDGQGGQDEIVVPRGVRPTITGSLRVHGGLAPGEQQRPGGLFLNGLALTGAVVVEAGDLERVDVAHCDVGLVDPLGAGLVMESAPGMTNAALALHLYRSRCGTIEAVAPIASLHLEGTIVAASPGSTAIALPGAAAHVSASTVIGGTDVRTLDASDALLDGPLDVEHHQAGCLRFSYAPPDTTGPRRYRCQPDLALASASNDAERATIRARVRPSYVTTTVSRAGFGLLAPQTPIEIRTAAQDGSEAGAFHHLQFARREANFLRALRQYLRFGLDAGLLIES